MSQIFPVTQALRQTLSDAELKAILFKLMPNNQWLTGMLLKLEEGQLSVTFIHPHFALWFMRDHRKDFEKKLEDYFGCPVCPKYEQNPVPPVSPKDSKTTDCEEDPFADFFCGEQNTTSLAAAKKAAEGSLGSSLIICGASGTGKSHILEAIKKSFIIREGLKSVVKCSAEFFCSQCRSNKLRQQAEIFWQNHKALLLDDLQEVAGQNSLQEGLIPYLDPPDALSANDVFSNRTIVLAFSGPSDLLANFGSRFRSRLESGLLIELAEPDLNVRLQYLTEKASNLPYNRNNLLLIAMRASTIPLLAGMLNKIEFYFRLHGRYPDPAELEDLTNHANFSKPLNYQKILNEVGRRLELKTDEIKGNSRKPDLVFARHFAMYICRRQLGFSYPQLGRIFGGKDHSTVMHAIKKISAQIDSDKKMHNLLTEIETNLRNGKG